MFACACGGTGPVVTLPPAGDAITLHPLNGGFSAAPIVGSLDSVSNDDGQYTGEFDHFQLEVPEDGRLQFALTWFHDADFDLLITSDAGGSNRLAEGLRDGDDPEYVGLPVSKNQTVHVFVVGWEGEPGGYTLEAILLPPESVVFDVIAAPDTSTGWPRNRPIVFGFNVPVEPGQSIEDKIVFVAPGHQARGTWCIEANNLVFLPELPNDPGDANVGLIPGLTYTVQFRSGAKGLRATTGEYLTNVVTGEVVVEGYEDENPERPPRVIAIDHDPSDPWSGSPIQFFVDNALLPATVTAQIFLVETDGSETPLPTTTSLSQEHVCISIDARIVVEPAAALPPASTIRIRIPGTVLGISGEIDPRNGLTGPDDSPAGQGIAIELATP
ncbi:MAG: hypothetical protein V3T86_05540 [Planctomycetota bacterium]